MITQEYWRRCSSCKNPINYKAAHYVCSVSTCNRKRVGYVFCSVHCWERHLPGARHRDAAAVEAKAPTYEQWKAEIESEEAPQTSAPAPGGTQPTQGSSSGTMNESKRVIVRGPTQSATPTSQQQIPKEVLVVVSKMKAYIKARSDMNTSDAVMDVLSDKLRALCDEAIDNARKAGRKTVLDRDFDGATF